MSYPFFLKKKSFLKGSTTLAKIKAMTLAETTQKPDFTTLEWPSQNSMKMKISQFVSLDPYSTAPYKYTSKPAKLDCRPFLFFQRFSLLFFPSFSRPFSHNAASGNTFQPPFSFSYKRGIRKSFSASVRGSSCQLAQKGAYRGVCFFCETLDIGF